MNRDRIHRALSEDGTQIAARVHGRGPPLVLVSGALEDGDLLWDPLVPHLADRFTCYLMSTRGRGLSADHPDHSPERLVQDIRGFVDSIGEPVGLVGESGGGALALGAAARTGAVSAVAVHEPAVLATFAEEDVARFEAAVARMTEAADEGRLEDAVRTFFSVVANDDEWAALSASDYFGASARYVPVFLQELKQDGASRGPGPTDPSTLAKIRVPVLLLRGSRTALPTSFADSLRHVAEHVGDPHVVELADVGHLAPALAPEPVADELARFFAATRPPA